MPYVLIDINPHKDGVHCGTCLFKKCAAAANQFRCLYFMDYLPAQERSLACLMAQASVKALRDLVRESFLEARAEYGGGPDGDFAFGVSKSAAALNKILNQEATK